MSRPAKPTRHTAQAVSLAGWVTLDWNQTTDVASLLDALLAPGELAVASVAVVLPTGIFTWLRHGRRRRRGPTTDRVRVRQDVLRSMLVATYFGLLAFDGADTFGGHRTATARGSWSGLGCWWQPTPTGSCSRPWWTGCAPGPCTSPQKTPTTPDPPS